MKEKIERKIERKIEQTQDTTQKPVLSLNVEALEERIAPAFVFFGTDTGNAGSVGYLKY